MEIRKDRQDSESARNDSWGSVRTVTESLFEQLRLAGSMPSVARAFGYLFPRLGKRLQSQGRWASLVAAPLSPRRSVVQPLNRVPSRGAMDRKWAVRESNPQCMPSQVAGLVHGVEPLWDGSLLGGPLLGTAAAQLELSRIT